MMPTGFIKVLIHNIKELKTYPAEIAMNRETVIEGAAQLAIRITNPNARRIRAEENK